MKLSVIIVNYNVKHFLEQCLQSVQNALKGIRSEIFVVDNNSVDGSCQMMKEKFHGITLIENRDNKGFSVANNQAIKQARGEYILLLNPDTVVEEETFDRCIHYMDEHREAGGLGVKMIDGKGNFLPESKRGLPTPMVAFFKIFGISRLFPRSKLFNRYHLGYLDPSKIHEIDILPGAFMFLRKSALEKVGLLDEDFFMYGEDIDLSYRMIQAGFKNIYFPETTIIHYKGESTKKGSLNYVILFYKAMITFARKHFSKRNQRMVGSIINLAIYFRAVISMAKRIFSRIFLPILDAVIIYLGFMIIKPLWEMYKFSGQSEYPNEFSQIIIPAYIIIWLITIFFSGGYEKKLRLLNLIKGVLIGAGAILLIYALLPGSLRFSRAMIILGSVWTLMSLLLVRWLLWWINPEYFPIHGKKGKRIIIVGSKDETERVKSILERTDIKPRVMLSINPGDHKVEGRQRFPDKIMETVKINKIEEVIFCSADIPAQEIIRNMMALTSSDIDFKIAPPEMLSIIGSNSIESSGEIYLISLNSVSRPTNRRKKRSFDIFSSLLLLLLLPVTIWLVKRRYGFIKNIGSVILGKKSWIGFSPVESSDSEDLPMLRPGIINPALGKGITEATDEILQDINLIYAKDYRVMYDIQILIRAFKYLGNK